MTTLAPLVLRAHATAGELERTLATDGSAFALRRSRALKWRKGSLADFEAHALYRVAAQYNDDDARFLEIGTLYGWTAALMAEAAPRAHVVTLNPSYDEWVKDTQNLLPWPNVAPLCVASWDYLVEWSEQERQYHAPPRQFSFVFIDGDHKRVARDMPWWNYLAPGGLLLLHDVNTYQSPKVQEAVDRLTELLSRDPEVCVTDPDHVGRGLVGFYKRDGDPEWSAA